MTDEWVPRDHWPANGKVKAAPIRPDSHKESRVLDTPYLEKCTLKPFGPVDNGDQHLYGLDYRSAMWRGGRESLPYRSGLLALGMETPAR